MGSLLNWTLFVFAIVMAASLSGSLIRILAEDSRLRPRPFWTGLTLPWAMRRLNRFVPAFARATS